MYRTSEFWDFWDFVGFLVFTLLGQKEAHVNFASLYYLLRFYLLNGKVLLYTATCLLMAA